MVYYNPTDVEDGGVKSTAIPVVILNSDGIPVTTSPVPAGEYQEYGWSRKPPQITVDTPSGVNNIDVTPPGSITNSNGLLEDPMIEVRFAVVGAPGTASVQVFASLNSGVLVPLSPPQPLYNFATSVWNHVRLYDDLGPLTRWSYVRMQIANKSGTFDGSNYYTIDAHFGGKLKNVPYIAT